MRPTRPRLAVVIAAYDEAGNVEGLCERLLCTLKAMDITAFELILVVEGDDGTAGIVRSLARRQPEIRLVEPAVGRGLGAAFRLGFAAISPLSDIVVTMDADLNHQPEEIPLLVDALQRYGADIVLGSRRVPGSCARDTARWRAWLTRIGNWGLKRCFRTEIRDLTSGFRAYRADALRQLDFRNNGFAFLPEIALLAVRAKLRLEEVPISFTARRDGKSKMRIGSTSSSYLKFIGTYAVSTRSQAR
jgi:dolichol-phosphate mannosyltransferase